MVIDARGIRSVEVSLSSAYDEYAQEADRAEQVVQYKQVVDEQHPLVIMLARHFLGMLPVDLDGSPE